MPEEALSKLMIERPSLRSYGYWQCVTRAALREIDPGMRSDTKHLVPPRLRGIWDSKAMYVTEGELKENGVKVDGVVYSAMVGAGAEGWMGKEGFLIQGPYDVHRFVDGDETWVPNVTRALEILRGTGNWDLLASSGAVYRPLLKGHLPLLYYGAYGLGGDYKDFVKKDGLWASDGNVHRGFEVEGMQSALNFDDFRMEATVLYATGVDDVKGALVKVVMGK
jgi:hypothetical protein